MKRRRIIIAGVLSFIFLFIGSSELFSFQFTNRWQPLQRAPGYLDNTFPPFMVADQNKTIHAFASQWVGDDQLQLAIVYRQWTAVNGWTNPIDIILPPVGETQVYDVYLDPQGTIHLLFQSGNSDGSSIYYSKAYVADANRATAWSKPELVGEAALSPGTGAIIGDGNENLVIIYNGYSGGNGVYEVHSFDGGQSWSEAEPIYLTFDTKLIPYSLHMAPGQDGTAHAVWNVVDDRGVDASVHYAHLIFDTHQWSTPILLDEKIDRPNFFGPSFPEIVDNGQEIVVMYNSGNPDEKGEVDAGRPVQRVRTSTDGGRSWSNAISPFPRHLGRSGSHDLVVDGNGGIHALFIQRIEPKNGEQYAPIGGLWHGEFENGRWSEPELIDLGDFAGHDVHAVISQGNNLLVTMREDPGVAAKGVWYSSVYLNVPELPISIPATPSPIPTRTPTPTPPAISDTPTPAAAIGVIRQDGIPPGASKNPSRPILFGLLPVTVLLFGIIMVFQLYRNRH